MKKALLNKVLALLAGALMLGAVARAADNPYVGAWALTIPGGAAGWLGVKDDGGKLSASILWGGGSVLPVSSAKVDGGKLIITRVQEIQAGARKGGEAKGAKKTEKAGKGEKKAGKGKGKAPAAKDAPAGKITIVETITATAEGDDLKLTTVKQRNGGPETDKAEFTGKRLPPVPPAPDLAKVKFGEPIQLFNGKDLTGWKLLREGDVSAWSVKDGVLNNNPVQEEGKPHIRYGNIRTEQEFEDFKLTLETCPPKDSNSGVYLRGIYEIQIMDSYGKPLDSHNMGAVYSRICPTVSAEKPAGEWQSLELTLVDRHITVVLNGKTIIDNQPVEGCTGGALWSDVFKPGPIYLQGDHSGANYRNIVLRPVVK